jgi:class 3 adenylate cyclase
MDNKTDENKIIVTFDICSSSNIIEDLHLTNNLRKYISLLISLKRFLRDNALTVGYEVYKFTGDGWIILFPDIVTGNCIMDFLNKLSVHFQKEIKRVTVLLERKPEITGITFGVDMGLLSKIIMLGKREYIGRAINIACRLQTAIKDKDSCPQYKVLMSKHAFERMKLGRDKYKPRTVTRNLRNIRDGKKYGCIKLDLFG